MDTIQELIAVSNKFISLVDNAQDMSFLWDCNLVLPQIYYLGQSLPDVNVSNDGTNTDNRGENEAIVREKIDGLLNKNNYRLTNHPSTDDAAILSVHLAEIYADLNEMIVNYEKSDAGKKTDAIWDFKFNIQGHTGRHIVSVMELIHGMIY